MKSDCTEYQKQIARLLLGDLTPEERESLEKHLSGCPVCSLEKEHYAETVSLLQVFEEEPAPRHFFVHPPEKESNPWRLFRQMKPRWQAATAVAAALFILLGIAAISGLEVRADTGGWAVSFGSNVDVAALKADLMRAVIERDNASAARMDRLREDVGGVLSNLTSQQRVLLTALAQQDALLEDRIKLTENRLKVENTELAQNVYDALTKQRAQDLGIIDLRLDSFENSYAVKESRTNAILGVLLQKTGLESQ